ncbi:MAG TPA: PAS domain-containing protein, partial [Burkholderiaceae bacterium]|nr:PAS domain-containing protein [Burkholderiaceae bacterium]
MAILRLRGLLGRGARMRRANLHAQLMAIHRVQAVVEFDLQGHILMANQNFLDTVGYSLPEIVGKHHLLFVDAQERTSPAYVAFWQKLGQGLHDAGCYKRIAKDGREVWL